MKVYVHTSLPFVALVAALGSATMAGLLFAFSNFVMRALSQLAPACGMEAMQRINVTIINPVFVVLFVGTPLLFVLTGIGAATLIEATGRGWLLAGAVIYLAGVLGVTMFVNVPLNDAIAPLPVTAAVERWPDYVAVWTTWNHVRTLWAFVATVVTVIGAYRQLIARTGM